MNKDKGFFEVCECGYIRNSPEMEDNLDEHFDQFITDEDEW